MFQRAFVSVRVSARPDVGVGKLAYLPEQPQAMRGRDLQIALEFAFLDDPLMRLVGALDAILTIIAFGRKQLRDLVHAACRATVIDPGSVEHALADLELVIAQVHSPPRRLRRTPRRRNGNSKRCRCRFAFMLNSITEIDSKRDCFDAERTHVALMAFRVGSWRCVNSAANQGKADIAAHPRRLVICPIVTIYPLIYSHDS